MLEKLKNSKTKESFEKTLQELKAIGDIHFPSLSIDEFLLSSAEELQTVKKQLTKDFPRHDITYQIDTSAPIQIKDKDSVDTFINTIKGFRELTLPEKIRLIDLMTQTSANSLFAYLRGKMIPNNSINHLLPSKPTDGSNNTHCQAIISKEKKAITVTSLFDFASMDGSGNMNRDTKVKGQAKFDLLKNTANVSLQFIN